MPIPMSNMEKNIQQPQTTKGQALNLSREAASAVAIAQDFSKTVIGGITKAVDAAMQYKKDKQDAADLLLANNAFSEYERVLGDLNTQLKNTDKADTLEFKPKYEKQAEAAHANIIDIMDNRIKNDKVREDLRNRINSINNRNASSSFLYFESQRKALEKEANDNAIESIANNAITQFERTSGSNQEKLNNLFSQVDSRIIANLQSSGDRMVGKSIPNAKSINEGLRFKYANEIMQKRQHILSNLINHLNATNRNTAPWKETATAIQVVEDAMAYGMVDEKWGLEQLKSLEQKALGVELMRHPEVYWDQETGEYNRDLVFKNVKYLSQDEIERAAKSVASVANSNPNASPEAGGFIYALNKEAENDDELWRAQHGFLTEEEIKEMNPFLSAEDLELKKQENLEYRKRTSPSEIYEHYLTLHAMRKKQVLVVPGLSSPVEVTSDGMHVVSNDITPEQKAILEDGLQKGTIRPLQPWNHNSEFETLYNNFDRMSKAILRDKGAEGIERVVRGESHLLGMAHTYNYSSRDAMVQILWTLFNEEAKVAHEGNPNTLFTLDDNGLKDAIVKADQLMRNGGHVFAYYGYANEQERDNSGALKLENGRPIPIRNVGRLNVNASHDSLTDEEKDSVKAIAIEAFRQSVSPGRFRDMKGTQTMKLLMKEEQKSIMGQPQSSGNRFIDNNTVYNIPSISNGIVSSTRFGGPTIGTPAYLSYKTYNILPQNAKLYIKAAQASAQPASSLVEAAIKEKRGK